MDRLTIDYTVTKDPAGDYVDYGEVKPYIEIVNILSEIEIGNGDCPMWLNSLVLRARNIIKEG